MNQTIKHALLAALNGKPVSTLYAKAKPHHTPTKQAGKPKQITTGLAPLVNTNDEARHARFMKGWHGLPGYAHRSQVETLRDQVGPYLVRGVHQQQKGLPKW